MKFLLSEFEQHIDETILKRGFSYFKNGYVSPPEEISASEYECVVEGTEDYTVNFNLKNGVISEAVCSCPYDYGDICKHIAAICFYLEQDDLGITTKSESGKQKGPKKNPLKKSKPKTISDKIEDLLTNLSREEVNDFLRKQCENNRSFRQTFLSAYAHLYEEESIDFYSKQVKAILKSYEERGGFINYYSSGKVGKEVNSFLDTAQEHFANNREQSALYICFAVAKEVMDALNYADDSNGYLGGNIADAIDLLFEISIKSSNENVRQQIFKVGLEYFDKKYFEGMDWQLQMLSLAKNVAAEKEQYNEIRKRLNSMAGSNFFKQEAQQIELGIIKDTEGEDAAQKFLVQNISNPSFRKNHLEKLFAEKRYEEAKQIVRGGIANDHQYAGLVLDWYEWLLKIAIAESDKEDILLLARKLYFEAGGRINIDFYEILKKEIPITEWNEYARGLVAEWKKKPRWEHNYKIADLLIREQWFDKLFEMVSSNPHLKFIEQYEQHLSKNYAAQIGALYEKGILEYLKNNVGRSHYRHACFYIRKIIKLGEKDQAEQLIAKLRQQYVQRRALIEELNVFK